MGQRLRIQPERLFQSGRVERVTGTPHRHQSIPRQVGAMFTHPIENRKELLGFGDRPFPVLSPWQTGRQQSNFSRLGDSGGQHGVTQDGSRRFLGALEHSLR